MIQVKDPFPSLVYTVNYSDLNSKEAIPVCQNFIDTAPMNSPLEQGGRSSASNRLQQPHMHPYFNNFYNWLWPHVMDIIVNKWGMEPNIQYGISNSWCNVHTNGNTTLEHTHGSAVMAIAHYISLPKGSGRIEVQDPLEPMRQFYMRKRHNGWYPIDIAQGDVVMFPGWMNHRTEQSTTDEPRWVLTTNVVCYSVTPSMAPQAGLEPT